MTIFYSDIEPLSKYSWVTLHLYPVTRILTENSESIVTGKFIADHTEFEPGLVTFLPDKVSGWGEWII